MAYWTERPGSKDNIRTYRPPLGWLCYADRVKEDKTIEGCSRILERHLINALNSTNLLLLTGAGASFAAKNSAGKSDAPGMLDLLKSVKDAVGDDAFKEIVKVVLRVDDTDNVEKLLTHCKLYIALHGEEAEIGQKIAAFIITAEKTILGRVNFIDENSNLNAHEVVLRKIARRGIRKPRTKIFTTNYDLCFETAARRLFFVVLDGFSFTLPQVYDAIHFTLDIVRRDPGKDVPDYFENVLHLYKLHGSLDWRRVGANIFRSVGSEGKPVLIYPRDSKYQESFEPPYLDMMGSFQAALREPDTTLVVSGFGFNDDHISQPILQALESNMSFRLVVCNPNFIADSDLEKDEPSLLAAGDQPNRFLRKFLALARLGDQRVTLLNGRFEDLADALPDLVAETERERHAARIKVIRDNEATAYP